MSTRAATLRLALASSVVLGAGCVRLNWRKATLEQAPPRAAIERLAPGAELTACLRELGAPNLVWEQPGGAFAMAYAWSRTRRWGLGVSAPLARHADASFDYATASDEVEGVVLWFDADWRLVRSQRGRLRDLAPTRARPASVPPRTEVSGETR